MAVTKEDLLAKHEVFTEARDAAAAAHVTTSAAQANVLSVTTIEQGHIDAAVAQFDVATTEAKAEATSAAAAEVVANDEEDTALSELFAAISAFKDEA